MPRRHVRAGRRQQRHRKQQRKEIPVPPKSNKNQSMFHSHLLVRDTFFKSCNHQPLCRTSVFIVWNIWRVSVESDLSLKK